MAQPDLLANSSTTPRNNVQALEATLRRLFTEQRRLRELLEQTRTELDQVNRDVLRVQAEFCTDEAREMELRRCLERVLGYDSYIDPAEIEAALKDPQSLTDFLAELEAIPLKQPGVGDG